MSDEIIMRYLLVIDSLGGGGAQRQLVNLAIGLTRRGHQVTVFTFAKYEWYLPALLDAGVDYVCRPKKGRFDLLPSVSIYLQIRSLSPDIVIAFLRTPSLYCEILALLRMSPPLIVSERAGARGEGLSFSERRAGIGHLLADHITTNSRDYMQKLVKGVPRANGRVSVIYNGVSEEFFSAGRGRLEYKNCEMPPCDGVFGSKTRYCAVAARVSPEKGLLTLIRALKHVVNNGGNPIVEWIGPIRENVEYYNEVVGLIRDLDLGSRWIWKGPQKEMSKIYSMYDALVLPSLSEGVANTMCEAMASGLPVVVTSIADNAFVVREGMDGFLCPPGDENLLAKAMLDFERLPIERRFEMSVSSQHRAHSLFSMEAYVDQWEQLSSNVSRALS